MDRFDAHNNFYGADLGITGEVRRGAWMVGMLAKVAVGAAVDRHQVIAFRGRRIPERGPRAPAKQIDLHEVNSTADILFSFVSIRDAVVARRLVRGTQQFNHRDNSPGVVVNNLQVSLLDHGPFQNGRVGGPDG